MTTAGATVWTKSIGSSGKNVGYTVVEAGDKVVIIRNNFPIDLIYQGDSGRGAEPGRQAKGDTFGHGHRDGGHCMDHHAG